MTSENFILPEERRYWIQLPNLIDDSNLSVYAFRLYCHFKRRAGDKGECFESSANLAKACNMSAGSVSKAKRELQNTGLIEIKTRRKPGGEYHVITIRDIWLTNMAAYSKECSPGEQNRSPHEQNCSPGETKKNPLRKTSTTTVPQNKNGFAGENGHRHSLVEKLGVEIEKQGRKPEVDAIEKAIAKWARECDIANRDLPEEQQWKYTNVDAILERYEIFTIMAEEAF